MSESDQSIGDGSQLMAAAAAAVTRSGSLEQLSRPFLDLLHKITGLESTYLTEVLWDDDEQTVLFADNVGDLVVPEGITVPWSDTLCRRALESGTRFTSDVPTTFPGSAMADAMGLQTYISVPVTDQNEAVMGTLCASSGQRREVGPEALAIMELLAKLIAEQWQRDLAHAAMAMRAANAEEQLRSRALFLAEAEHKLKSPLTILRGWSTMLVDEWKTYSAADCQRAFETMQRASIIATTQVEELIDEARSQVLATQIDASPMDVGALVQLVGDEMQGATTIHKIVVSSPVVTVEAIADAKALWQVLWHLGENAIKYSPDGGIIELQAEREGGFALVSVSDEGIGVPDDIDLFAPFSRSTSDEFQNIAGSGLGLHIVKNLVQAMGGTVQAERRSDGGSVFRVRLPASVTG